MSGFFRCVGELNIEGIYPQCLGSWEVVEIQPPFDPSQLDPASLGTAFGVGFSLVAAFMAFSIGIRTFLNFIKNS
jgi:hypothetical protein